MDKIKKGDWVEIKSVDELLETYHKQPEIAKAINDRTDFISKGQIFTRGMYSCCGKSFEVERVVVGGLVVRVPGNGYIRHIHLNHEWISDKDVEFSIDKEKVLLLI